MNSPQRFSLGNICFEVKWDSGVWPPFLKSLEPFSAPQSAVEGTAEFKKVARILKQVYAELTKEAVDSGVAITSNEYEQLVSLARERVLSKLGFTIEEYRLVKSEVEKQRGAKVTKSIADVNTRVDQINAGRRAGFFSSVEIKSGAFFCASAIAAIVQANFNGFRV